MNIDSKDLMIGNLVKFSETNTIFEVTEILNTGLSVESKEESIWTGISEFEGVPLSEEILLKCGFDYVKEVGGYCDKNHIIYQTNEGWDIMINCLDKCNIEIKYLHTLQNLIKLLTGNDLDVSKLTNKI